MSWYGTEREREDVGAIDRQTSLQTEIINPADEEFTAKAATAKANGWNVMAIFLEQVEQADAIAYRTFDDDYIGAGVAQEILTAALHGKQIFRLMDLTHGKGPVLFEQRGIRAAFGPRVLTIVETKDRIKRGVM
jgi:hypothetical protein